jgi:hypothetical protein
MWLLSKRLGLSPICCGCARLPPNARPCNACASEGKSAKKPFNSLGAVFGQVSAFYWVGAGALCKFIHESFNSEHVAESTQRPE